MKKQILGGAVFAILALSAQTAWSTCNDFDRAQLLSAVQTAVSAGAATGGYQLNMWATLVDETGKICEVVTSGNVGKFAGNSAWLGSRVISAQKANTANAFSLDGYAISTANLYKATQPGGSLFGLQHSNPVDASVAYLGAYTAYGTAKDPLKGHRIGGINVFGGGLALYKDGKKIGALGVSGDTSCRDHAFAWRVRGALNLHPTAPTVGITTANVDFAGATQTPIAGATKGDELIIESSSDSYWNAWSHPGCPNASVGIATANGTVQAP